MEHFACFSSVEYAKQQDPYLLKTGQHNSNGHDSLIALSPDGRTVAIATGVNISVYSTLTAQCEEVILDVHTSKCPLNYQVNIYTCISSHRYSS